MTVTTAADSPGRMILTPWACRLSTCGRVRVSYTRGTRFEAERRLCPRAGILGSSRITNHAVMSTVFPQRTACLACSRGRAPPRYGGTAEFDSRVRLWISVLRPVSARVDVRLRSHIACWCNPAARRSLKPLVLVRIKDRQQVIPRWVDGIPAALWTQRTLVRVQLSELATDRTSAEVAATR